MLDTGWADWSAAAEAAYQRLAERTDQVVVAGLSMGGSLTLWTALAHPEVAGIVCINPATRPQAADVIEMVTELVEEGNEVMPGIGGDIADPDVVESAYPGTPLRALLSFQTEGLAAMADRYGELTMPGLVITSRQDHVVDPSDSEHLAASLGGEVEHVWLERSYHVATQDYDRDDIVAHGGGVRRASDRQAGGVLIASIPSPSFNSIDIGPISLNLYGLAIALGVIAAVWLFGRRLEEREIGTKDDASAIAIWAVLAGVIGARLYHVATDIEKFRGEWFDIVKIWEGGLGIPGGLLLGTAAGLWATHRRGIPMAAAATCAAPAIPLAQAIGRWGNYFNQELFGRPTTLPWGLEIDAEHLPAGYAVGTTFHPTFLYESLWCLGLCFLLLWIDRRFRPAPGQLMAMYFIGYGIGRFWVEGLRIDEADHVGGLRFNQWVAVVMVVAGAIALLFMRRNPIAEPEPNLAFVGAGDGQVDDEPGRRRPGRRRLDDAVSPVDEDPIPDRTDAETPASE